MCVFTGPASVSGTSIYARLLDDGDSQLLVYETELSLTAPTAMLLGLPVDGGALEFLNFEHHRAFFPGLDGAFQTAASKRAARVDISDGVEVQQVGDYLASFVTDLNDLVDVDPRFALPPGLAARLPPGLGWAVFRLGVAHPGTRIHPMAMRFRTRRPGQLFFPTIHVHDGAWHDVADFHHTLYFHGTFAVQEGPAPTTAPVLSTTPMRQAFYWHVHPRNDQVSALIDIPAPLWRARFKGPLHNADVVLGPPPPRALPTDTPIAEVIPTRAGTVAGLRRSNGSPLLVTSAPLSTIDIVAANLDAWRDLAHVAPPLQAVVVNDPARVLVMADGTGAAADPVELSVLRRIAIGRALIGVVRAAASLDLCCGGFAPTVVRFVAGDPRVALQPRADLDGGTAVRRDRVGLVALLRRFAPADPPSRPVHDLDPDLNAALGAALDAALAFDDDDDLGALMGLDAALAELWRRGSDAAETTIDDALRALPGGADGDDVHDDVLDDVLDDDVLGAFTESVRGVADVLREASPVSRRVLSRLGPSLRQALSGLPTPQRFFVLDRLAGLEPLLLDVLTDGKTPEGTRVAAARVLGLRRCRQAVPALRALVDDEAAPGGLWLRETAREALERITGVLCPIPPVDDSRGPLRKVVVENGAVRSFESLSPGGSVWLPAAPNPLTNDDRRRRLFLADERRLVVGLDVAGVLYETAIDLTKQRHQVAGLSIQAGWDPICVQVPGGDRNGSDVPAVVVLPTTAG
jgi:hypothetical protein